MLKNAGSLLSVVLLTCVVLSETSGRPPELDDQKNWQEYFRRPGEQPYFCRVDFAHIGLPGHEANQLSCEVTVYVGKLKFIHDNFETWVVSCRMNHTRNKDNMNTDSETFNGPYLGSAEKRTGWGDDVPVWSLTAMVQTPNGHITDSGPPTNEGKSERSMSVGVSTDGASATYSHTYELKDVEAIQKSHGEVREWTLDMPNGGSKVLEGYSWEADLIIRVPEGQDLVVDLVPTFHYRSQYKVLGTDFDYSFKPSDGSSWFPQRLYTRTSHIRVHATAAGKSLNDPSGRWLQMFEGNQVSFRNGQKTETPTSPDELIVLWDYSLPKGEFGIVVGKANEPSVRLQREKTGQDRFRFAAENGDLVLEFDSPWSGYWKTAKGGGSGGRVLRLGY